MTAGIGEELLFRGVVQALLERWLGPWIALGVASILFGLVHALTPTYALLAAFAGACIVSSVHRLHLLRRFDTVVVMDGGRIIDSGPPDEVRQRRPELFAHSALEPVAETRAA